MTDSSLRNLLNPPESANTYWFQQRGRTFERVLTRILSRESLEPRTSMRPSGEEIDGSFSIDDCFFLLEAKWHANPIAASSLYAFKGKVDGKLVGTIGVFFSMSDYSTDAVDALLAGKELNLVLFGQTDLLLIEDGSITMRDAMRVKLRFAAEYGQPFFALETHLKERGPASQPEWTILVEGAEDVRTIEELLGRFETTAKIEVVPAGGQLSVAALAQHLKSTGKENVAAIVTPIPDAALQAKHLQELKSSGAELVLLNGALEDWLGNYVSVDYYNATAMLTNRAGKMARRYARNAELPQLLASTPNFSAFINKLGARPKQ